MLFFHYVYLEQANVFLTAFVYALPTCRCYTNSSWVFLSTISIYSTIEAMRFKKRVYDRPRDFFASLYFLIKNQQNLRRATREGLISPAFKERLLMAVTSVNGCRYCSYVHTREALKNGVTREELVSIISHDAERYPEEEAIAITYAQHWAESNGNPALDAVQKLEQVYGTEKTEAINLILRTIHFSNLMGNSFDYLLYRISFGRRGA